MASVKHTGLGVRPETRSAGRRLRENAGTKEAEVGSSTERVVDAGRRSQGSRASSASGVRSQRESSRLDLKPGWGFRIHSELGLRQIILAVS